MLSFMGSPFERLLSELKHLPSRAFPLVGEVMPMQLRLLKFEHWAFLCALIVAYHSTLAPTLEEEWSAQPPAVVQISDGEVISWPEGSRVMGDHIDYDVHAEDYEELLHPTGDAEQRRTTAAERYLVRGTAYLKRDQLERARQDLERARRMAPNDARVYHRLTQTLLGMNRMREALWAADRALELEPGLRVVYGLRSWIHSRLGHTREANRDWNSFSCYQPVSVGDFAHSANEGLRRGQVLEALAAAEQGLALSPEGPNAGLKGIALTMQGLDSQALPYLQRAVEEAPYSSTWRIQLLRVQRKLGLDESESLAAIARLQTEQLQ